MIHIKKTIPFLAFLLLFNSVYAQVFLDNNASFEVQSISSGASWLNTNGQFDYTNNGTNPENRALLYSTDAFQSNDGFKLTIEYTSGSIEDIASHNFSFGLISTETDLSAYTGFNPFRADQSVYSLGANITKNEDATARGLNFSDGTSRTTLDESGTRVQFVSEATTKVTIEIGIGGYWSYRINDMYEASGVVLEGFDLTKSFHVVIYGQDDDGGEKSIQSIKLEKRYAAGERAKNVRGTWSSGIDVSLMDAVKDLKTLDGLGVGFTSGASQSALHMAPHKLMERLALKGVDGNDTTIDLIAPTWGDLNLDEPEVDDTKDQMLKVKAAGFKVKAYTNSENFVGVNAEEYVAWTERWKEWCDTDPEAQAFINSQPFHTGVWNKTTQQYEDATSTYPNRKYMFCYAEFILKDHALRYGDYIDNWIFDDGGTMGENGDNATSGIIEEQRIYQAYSNAVHAGNPEIPTAFNNSRSNLNYASYPFAHAVQFEDFTFGHAFGGNNNHAEKVNGNQFNLNYQHVTRMTETNGNVHDGGNWDWDDKIVGNFHSKISTTAWKFGPAQAWEQDDFNQWNLEAMQAGGAMTWDGSFNRNITGVYDWVIPLLKGLDDHLCQYQSPGAPNWARAYTILPDATVGEAYYHVLIEGENFWDPEGDDIIGVSTVNGTPSWLNINEDSENPGYWILSGVPTEATLLEFELQATDDGNLSGTREVKIQVNKSDVTFTNTGDGSPVWISDLFEFDVPKYTALNTTFIRGKEFTDFDGDELTIQVVGDYPWLTLEEVAPDMWTLNASPVCSGIHNVQLALSDGIHTTNTTLAINVSDPQFLDMDVATVNGNARWELDNDTYVYNNVRVNYNYSSLLYSSQAFQSTEGFRLKVNYTTGNIGSVLGHNFSFGLISTDTDLSTYAGVNPFGAEASVYSFGVNITANQGENMRGLNYTNGTSIQNLDASGTNVQFSTDELVEVILEVQDNGAWSYSINDIEEASGTFSEFDLSKTYHVAVYGQDDDGGGKMIHEIVLETCLDPSIITSIPEIDDGLFTVYPNPTLGVVQFEKDEEYTVYNSLGAQVLTGKGTTLNLINMPNGIYFIHMGDSIHKIIKE